MAARSRSEVIDVCRAVYRELRPSSSTKVPGNQLWNHVKERVRNGRPEELQTLRTLHHYMESSRKHRELLAKYQGSGEVSVEKSAHRVGLKLPQAKYYYDIDTNMDSTEEQTITQQQLQVNQ